MSKYQGPVFHKKLQTERIKPTTSPREVNRTQKQTIVQNEIPYYKKHDQPMTKEPAFSQKKKAPQTVSVFEDRTSTPFKVRHVPASFYSMRKKEKEPQEQTNYQVIFQNIAKSNEDFLLFDNHLSDFGKEQVEQLEEEQLTPGAEETMEVQRITPVEEEVDTETQHVLKPVPEALPQETVHVSTSSVEASASEEVTPKEPKKRGLSRSLAGMIKEEQEARLNKGRNIAHYFGKTLEERKTAAQPATISELLAQSRQGHTSEQLEGLLQESEITAAEQIEEENHTLVEAEAVEEDVSELEVQAPEVQEELPEETVLIEEQTIEPAQHEAEEPVIEEPQMELETETSEVEETAQESVSQPATITELLARAREDASSQDWEVLLGEEYSSDEEEPVAETEDIIEEPAESERKEVNEELTDVEEKSEAPSTVVETITVKPEPMEDTIIEEPVQTETPASEAFVVEEKQEPQPYQFPSLDLLQEPVKFETNAIDDWVLGQAEALNETLEAFNVEAQVVGWTIGPAITQFELQLGRGVKVNKITNLSDDLKLSLAAKDIRIEAPIPGKSTVGVEVPNRKSRPVMLSEVIQSEEFNNSTSPLTIALGVNLAGKKVVTTIDKMPHGLIAGATGSGKSVFINSLLVSLLYKATPNEVKLILIDPKAVELAPYNGLPHLLSPVISEPKAANEALKWAVTEMEERYQKLAAAGVRNVEGFNKKAEKNGDYALKIPYIVIIIDELADLMMVASNEVQDSIARITQKARAAGIHLIVATQRPSVDVVTGTIKNNIPTRVAFMVSSQIDSRTIIDTSGAEKLLGRGDMLFQGNGSSRPIRIQGTYVEDEIDDIVDFVKEQQKANYLFQSESLMEKAEALEGKDELLEEVLPFIVNQGTVSASSLQRKFRIGFNRASNLIDTLENKNLISGNKGSKPRDVFLTRTDYEEKFM